MKQISAILLVFLTTICFSQNLTIDELKTTNGVLKIQPITHGSLVLYHSNKTIYVDPYGGYKLYKNLKTPDIILITDIHGDHLDFKTLDSIDTSKTIFIVPPEVASKMPEKYKVKTTILNNGQGIHRFDFGTVVFGKPVCVQACGMKLSHRPDLGDYDTGTAVVTYEHGDQIAVHMCNGMPRGLKGINSDEVFGPEGVIQYEPMAGNIWMDHSQFTWTDKDKVVHAVKVEDWQGDWGLYRTMLCRHFVDCVRDPDKPRGPMCGAEEGHLALRVTKAVRASLETGRAVQL